MKELDGLSIVCLCDFVQRFQFEMGEKGRYESNERRKSRIEFLFSLQNGSTA